MSACRSCRAPVVWVETEARGDKPGRKMPLDADPENLSMALGLPNGNLIFTGAHTGEGTPIVRYVSAGLHRSHFASCPNAKQHRR